MARRRLRALVFSTLAGLCAGTALAAPTHFGTTIGPAVLCRDDIDPDFFYGYLNKHFNKPYKHEDGAWWWRAAGDVYGARVTEVFVSDLSTNYDGVGVITTTPANSLVKDLEAATPNATFRLMPDGSHRSSLGSTVVDMKTKSKLFCLKQARRLPRKTQPIRK